MAPSHLVERKPEAPAGGMVIYFLKAVSISDDFLKPAKEVAVKEEEGPRRPTHERPKWRRARDGSLVPHVRLWLRTAGSRVAASGGR
ncbi:unnamed protein product [Vitrella brassicaformis CCMP3155]|uniref:Uncharacterized protein n=1 Tax=Vitrella brassicaformis (strain CCMP3155) TaxID=1169540 RepID=A0A0G4FUU9_VITBC|nr:unnamed protein product [Vitrella brassicaformis CCMP3155]|eukprot:CEM18369.1 unnamed protein product [Vitrella brassicaformis CCMP3155]